MTGPTRDPYDAYGSGEPPWRTPADGPTDQPPWATQPPPIPSYVPPAPGQTYGPQDQLPGYPAPPPPPSSQPLRHADWGERVGATLVDWVILFVPLLVLTSLGDVLEDLAALVWFAFAGYLSWLNGSKGQTPGKALMGLKVVRDSDGSTLGGPVGLVRAVVLALMFAFTGGVLWAVALLWPAWDRKKQALHDKVVNAVVVAGYPRARLGKQLFLP